MATFTRSRQRSGRARPHTYDVTIKTHCNRHDLKANLYLEISSVIEQLEPGQKLHTVVIEMTETRNGYTRDTLVIKMPGHEFLAMARSGLEEMSKALLITAMRLDDNEARLRAEARQPNLDMSVKYKAKLDALDALINSLGPIPWHTGMHP